MDIFFEFLMPPYKTTRHLRIFIEYNKNFQVNLGLFQYLNDVEEEIFIGTLKPLQKISRPRLYFIVRNLNILNRKENFQYPHD
jgi:hypothetical protein